MACKAFPDVLLDIECTTFFPEPLFEIFAAVRYLDGRGFNLMANGLFLLILLPVLERSEFSSSVMHHFNVGNGIGFETGSWRALDASRLGGEGQMGRCDVLLFGLGVRYLDAVIVVLVWVLFDTIVI